MSDRAETITAWVIGGLIGILVGLGILICMELWNGRNESRTQQCKAKYGQEFHYSPVRGEPYCINKTTGEGKWSL